MLAIGRIKDLTGRRFGRLVVTGMAPADRLKGGQGWRCICTCDCGRQTVVRSKDLPNGNTVSCGCRKIETYLGRKIRAGTYVQGRDMPKGVPIMTFGP